MTSNVDMVNIKVVLAAVEVVGCRIYNLHWISLVGFAIKI
jgi:hypothetical protein